MNLVKLGADLLVGSARTDAKERERLRNDTLAWYHLVVTANEHQRSVLVTGSEREVAQQQFVALRARADQLLGGRRPFHWPLEFPEVFTATPQGDERQGFAAIIGNPPFMGGTNITGVLSVPYREYLVAHVAASIRGNADLCAYFFLRAGQLVRVNGDIGLLATNTIAQGDTREVGLDQLMARGFSIFHAQYPAGRGRALQRSR